jgi:thiol-disulfide isomerase/thioredoxin
MSKRGKKSEVLETSTNEEVGADSAPVNDKEESGSGSVLSNRKVIYAAVLVVIVVLAAWRLSSLTLPSETDSGLAGQVVQTGGAEVGGEDAGNKLVDFLQSRLETSYPGITVELVSVDDYNLIAGVYEVIVTITYQGEPQNVPYYVTKDGDYMFANVVDLNEPMPQPQPPSDTGGVQAGQPENPEIRTFTDSGEDICTEDGKPVINLFSTTWCPHCKWVADTYDNLVKEYVDAGKIVAHHYEIDIGDDILTEEIESSVPAEDDAMYRKFNPRGSIPTFVFGCKYYRIGNGYESQNDLAAEEAEFRAVIEDLLAAQ